jgi:hypothetical protein
MPVTRRKNDLFGADVVRLPIEKRRLEVHEHRFISGPRSRFAGTDRNVVRHSHEGGSERHKHPDTGPATYTIDKDEWFAATGLKGGGRKEFSDEPVGEQLAIVPLEDWQKTFEVHVGAPPPGFTGTGGGYAAACRMILGSRMTVSKVVPFPGPGRKRA